MICLISCRVFEDTFNSHLFGFLWERGNVHGHWFCTISG